MKRINMALKLSGVLSLFMLLSGAIAGQSISNYLYNTGWGIYKKDAKEVIYIRTFYKENHLYYFTVSPQSLNTEFVRSDSISIKPASWTTIKTRFSSTPYVRALQQSSINSESLQNAGLTKFRPSQKGIDLTIDLCPSHRPLDRIVFNDLINELSQVEKPVPIAISITGRWINMHPRDLNWLDSLVKAGDLSVVWINHTYNHYTAKNVPLTMNFMLAPGTNINSEVLYTEIALMEKNIIPSVFFRFPGLVSDQAVFDRILSLGLIPVGSDAWLAKGQWPTDGSIVLIHANGNEPVGVNDFIDLLKKEQANVYSKRWELFDLRESIVDDESR